MSGARNIALAGVQIGVEDAVRPRELDLGTVALANLQARPSEMRDQLIGRHPVEGPVIVTVGRSWIRCRRRRGGRRRWPRSTGGQEQGEGDGKDTHWRTC